MATMHDVERRFDVLQNLLGDKYREYFSEAKSRWTAADKRNRTMVMHTYVVLTEVSEIMVQSAHFCPTCGISREYVRLKAQQGEDKINFLLQAICA
jgi:hypothetical protein